MSRKRLEKRKKRPQYLHRDTVVIYYNYEFREKRVLHHATHAAHTGSTH